jgi:hypothetical protein
MQHGEGFVSSRHLAPRVHNVARLLIVAAFLPLAAQAVSLGRPRTETAAAVSCERLRDWAGSAPAGASERSLEALLPLVEDAVFVPVFGTRYRALTVADFRGAHRVLTECRRSGQLTPAAQHAAQQVWNERTQTLLLRQQEARQAKVEGLAQVQQALAALQPNEADASRIDSLKSRGEAVLRGGHPVRGAGAGAAQAALAGDVATFTQLVADTRLRVQLPVETQRVDQALAQASGAEGLPVLVEQLDRLARSPLSAADTAALRDKLVRRVIALGPEVAAAERRQIAPPTGDLAGLARHAAAVRAYAARQARALAMAPALSELMAELRTAREPLLPVAMDVASRLVRVAREPGAGAALLGQTFLEEELRGTRSGQELVAVADARDKLVKRIAADITGFGPQPEHQRLLAGGDVAPTTGAKGTANACDRLAAHPDDPGRLAVGVPDARLDAKSALSACRDSVKREPRNGRQLFQLARALLELDRPGDAVAALQSGAEAQHAGAHHYLSVAYSAGAPGLRKDAALARRHAEKAAALGWAVAAASDNPAFAEADYEDVRMMRAVYFGDTSLLDENTFYALAYLMAQAELLAQECRSFKLTERLRVFQTRANPVNPMAARTSYRT